MNRKSFFHYWVVMGILLLLGGCSDDSAFLQPEVTTTDAGDASADTRATDAKSFDTDWETMDKITLTNGDEISLPWHTEASSSHGPVFLKDMKKKDGWILVTHNLYEKPTVTTNNWKITFYNQASGDLKVYSYCPTLADQCNNAFWRVSFEYDEGWLNGLQEVAVPSSKKMSSGYIWRTSVQPNETNNYVSQGWNVIVVPNLTYDPNAKVTNTMQIDSYATETTHLEGFGTTTGTINGKIITYGESSNGIGTKIASYVGDGAKNWITSHLSGSSSIISDGVGGIVKKGLQKILGSLFGKSSEPSYTEQTVRLNIKADSKFDATLVTLKGTRVPSAKIELKKTDAELGNWNLSDNPTIYIHPVGVISKTFNGIQSDEAEYTYVASGNFKADIVINPQLKTHIKSYKVECFPVRYMSKKSGTTNLPQLPEEFRKSFTYGSLGSLESVTAFRSTYPSNTLIYSDDDYSIYDSNAQGYASYWRIWNKYGKASGSVPLYKYIYGPSNSDLCRGGDIKLDCTYNYVKVLVTMTVEFEGKTHTVISSRTYRPKFEWDPSYVSSYSSLSMSLLQSKASGDAVLKKIDNGCYDGLQRLATSNIREENTLSNKEITDTIELNKSAE